jgi:hypothetical protein
MFTPNPNPNPNPARRRQFENPLQQHDIGLGSNNAQSQLNNVPAPGAPNCVVVPYSVAIEPYNWSPPPSAEELRTFSCAMWMRALSNRIDDEARMQPRNEQPGPDDDLPSVIAQGLLGEAKYGPRAAFRRKSAFDEHCKAVASEYERIAEQLGLPDPIRICRVETCINSAVPDSPFCFRHFGFDEHLSESKLFQRCSYIHDGRKCCVPCLPVDSYCCGHSHVNEQGVKKKNDDEQVEREE